MDTISGEDLLEAATRGEPIEAKDWPQVLDDILRRLEDTLRSFPIPRIPDPDPPPIPIFSLSTSTRPDDEPPNSQASAATDKENAPPSVPRASSSTPTPRPPIPSFSAASQDATQPTQADIDMAGSQSPSSPTIPTQILDLYEYILQNLRNNFATSPPHTLQRLAELVLYPKRHYRVLPSYLRALDRVVCVSSPSHIFPLPAAALPSQGLLNGATIPTSAAAKESLGSDESLGGALLTPIPWLKRDGNSFGDSTSGSNSGSEATSQSTSNSSNELKSEDTEMVDGPNGVGKVETVTVINGVMVKSSDTSGSPTKAQEEQKDVNEAPSKEAQTMEESLREAGAITQGELLRLEQEAGVVPVTVANRSPARRKAIEPGRDANSYGLGEFSDPGAQIDSDDAVEEEEKPHARGPDAITDEDIGPQSATSPPGVLDMEKAVGRSLTQTVDGSNNGEKMSGMGEEAKNTDESADTRSAEANTSISETGRVEGKAEDKAVVE